MKTATLIKTLNLEFESGLRNITRDQKLYHLSHPIKGSSFEGSPLYSYVVVSAISSDSPETTETYIFPSDEEGKVLEFIELNGSYRGGTSHQVALHRAGYTLVSFGVSYDMIPEERWHSILRE